MGDEAQFGIRITGDATSAVAATQQTSKSLDNLGQAQEAAGKQAEKHEGHLRAMHGVFHALNEVVPGLGVLMQAAFSPVGAAISLALVVLEGFRDKMKEVNEEFRKMEEEAAKPATNRMEAWREATVSAAQGMNRLQMALADAARAEQTVKEVTERTSAAFRDQIQASATLADAVRENEIAQLDARHAAGLASEEEYALKRLDIEERYQEKKRAIQERAEMTEILIRRRAVEAAEMAQAGLKAAAEAAELKKVKALEDLASLDKAGVEERRKAADASLKAFENKYPQWAGWFEPFGVGAKPADVSNQLSTREDLSAFQASGGFKGMFGGAGLSEAYAEWARFKTAASGANAEWKQFPRAQAQRQVVADTASAQAEQAEKAAVGNEGFIAETRRDLGDRRSRFNVHHQEAQEIGALQRNTSVVQALAKAREVQKSDQAAVIEAMEHSTGLGAATLAKMREHAKVLADLTKQVQALEGNPPKVY